MTGTELLAELKRPGMVFLWIAPLDTYLPLTKTYLRFTLADLADRDTLDIRAHWDDDRAALWIDDFGPTEIDVG